MRGPHFMLALVALTGAGCGQLTFDRLPPDAELLFFAGALEPAADFDPRDPGAECNSVFCFGASASILTEGCLGLSEDVAVTVDDQTFSTTSRDFDQGIAVPGDSGGFIEPGGWQNEVVAWRCLFPRVEMFVSRDAPPRDEHEVIIESHGVARGLRFTDDGELLSCDFPRCRLTGDYQDLESTYGY